MPTGSQRLSLAIVVLLGGLACASAPQRPDLVLVIIDTWRWDALGANGSARPGITPNLDRMASRGVLFHRAFASSPWTLPAVASMVTGEPPTVHGAYGGLSAVGRIAPAVRTAAEELHQAGYATGAVINGPFLDASFGFGRGFEAFDYASGHDRQPLHARPSVEKALAWLAKVPDKRPAFLLLHLFDPHLSYDPPPPWNTRWTAGYRGRLAAPLNPLGKIRSGVFRPSAEDLAFMRGLYDGEVAYTDAALGDFVGLLEKVRPNRPRWIVVTADHGEEFADHGGFEHGHSMYRELTQVPLFVVPPDDGPGSVVEAQVRTMDVMPTLLEAAGLPAPRGIAGRSLLPLCQPPGGDDGHRLALSDREHLGEPSASLRDGLYTLIAWGEGRAPELYDARGDPQERHDVAAEMPDRVRDMAAKLASIRQGLDRLALQRGADQREHLDPELARELRALGYLGN